MLLDDAEFARFIKRPCAGPCFRGLGDAIRLARVPTREGAQDGVGYKNSVISSPLTQALVIGAHMEQSLELLKATHDEVKEAKETFQDLRNQVVALAEETNAQLLEQAKTIRSMRMTVVSEMAQSLTALKDVRKFFLESEYASEMERLERFVRVCKELQSLRADGTLEAVLDAALRLAVKERT